MFTASYLPTSAGERRRAHARFRRRRPARDAERATALVVGRRQRLLDQRDAGLGAGGEVRRRDCRASSLRWRPRSVRHCGAARRTAAIRAGSPAPPSFTLRSGRSAALAAAAAIVVRRAERDRVGGDQRLRRRRGRQIHAPAGRLAWPRDPRRRNRVRCARRRAASPVAARRGRARCAIGARIASIACTTLSTVSP